MRRCLFALLLAVALPIAAQAQSSPAPAGAVIHVPATEIAARAAKLGDAQASISFPVFEYGGYILRLEHRTDKPQKASVHEHESEMFILVSGSATIRTGGTLVSPTRDGQNLTAQSIDGGTLRELRQGDVLLIPPGVPHWVVKVNGATNLLSLHLPVR
jgi:mannose-6-phosphate isomerase-like protein (cupin superfamily)